MRSIRCVCALALALAVGLGCEADSSADPAASPGPHGKADGWDGPLPTVAPRRIILFIGDGMGVAALSAGAYARGELEMLSMPAVGFMHTHEHEFVTTDSAAAATAMASGAKTHFGAVGVTAGTTSDGEEDPNAHVETIVDVARAHGWRTGLVATTSVVDATPAAFAAHRASRRSKDAIARDLSAAGVDVLLGGGRSYFEDNDGVDLLGRMRRGGYSVASTRTGLRRVAGYATRVVGLLHDGDMPPVGSGERAVSLAEMTDVALRVLDRDNDGGFFLMVEGSQIDRRGHELDGPGAVDEVLDLDEAVGVALAYARGRDDTLVIATADHETGGLAVLDPATAAPHVEALGGDDAAIDRTAFPRSAPGPAPYAHVGARVGTLGAPEATDARLTTAFGYLSLASRSYYRGPGFSFRAAHSATMVPLLAEGPGASEVADIRDNADLGALLKAMVGAPSDPGAHRDDPADPVEPRNVVLVIADGAGLSSLTAARYVHGPLSTLDLDVRGLVATHALDRLVTDAAAASTAIATGRATRRGAVGTVPDGDDLIAAPTLLERAEDGGLATGLVTTGSLADPAVAGFYAHHADASDAPGRALELARLPAGDGVDVLFGGGRDDLGDEGVRALIGRGVVVETQWHGSSAGGAQLARVVADGALEPATVRHAPGAEQPTLGQMTRVALESLDGDPDGFLLVVHAGGLARAVAAQERGHGLVDEVRDLDSAVRAALDFAEGRDDTVVVVTGTRDSTLSVMDDHYGFHASHCGVAARCGGPVAFEDLPLAQATIHHGHGLDDADLQGDFGPPSVLLQYAWLPQAAREEAELADPGSAAFVPIFAAGPGASALSGFGDHARTGRVLGGWLER